MTDKENRETTKIIKKMLIEPTLKDFADDLGNAETVYQLERVLYKRLTWLNEIQKQIRNTYPDEAEK